jgi:hypothetical protein
MARRGELHRLMHPSDSNMWGRVSSGGLTRTAIPARACTGPVALGALTRPLIDHGVIPRTCRSPEGFRSRC